MNIYDKIQGARVELQDMKIKKSGRNQSFTYYELSDLLPAINELCLKYSLLTKFDIIVKKGVEMATLTIIGNCVDSNASTSVEEVKFTAPTASVELPRGQAIQGLGAKITYMRRYMLMTAFEIVENDMVDQLKQTLNDDLSDKDKDKIINAKDFEALTKICGELKKTYKATLIKPLYDKRKEELENKVIKK